ncbi:ABC transporter substrate-binding protein [Enterovirga rhinocerotis]|uniref:Amino acid/amide ABC transporter substrate-binding protein (HAAT family) n=1 Tax=Enterovirga rhinocerotis TaxID=1339210 RepID=A0A4R7C8J1_9HYPH|nr:ABC transporter substrate-binding protein [Enterovirga rhinocerotis]TDR93166.1 amino acid/amide ABC transporter substrate-binding protein (HAAT family) [Enterovirga rhinocerotis]
METNRRSVVLGGAGVLGAAALGFPKPAIAQSEPLRVGWLAAMTGPSSAPAVGFNRGVVVAAELLNAAGGVKGRKVEIITRDTQGDPTKAVNATQEMISQAKVHAIWGPTNSGESLAVTPIMARQKIPNIHPCVVNSLIDTKKYPNAFRISPSNVQWDDAVRSYCLKQVGAKKVAVIGDTTGYGVSAAKDSSAGFKKDGAQVVYEANIDATQPDMTPDLLRARQAGAEAIVVWSVSTGMDARLFNTRARMGWDVPFVGHPSMASGEIAGLLEKPANWEKVYAIGYRSCSYDDAGRLPPRSDAFVKQLKGKVELNDTLLWWVAAGFDAINLIAKAVAETGSSSREDIIKYWNTVSKYPGVYGEYTYTPENHDGYPPGDVVMSAANSGKDGTFKLAPGYS